MVDVVNGQIMLGTERMDIARYTARLPGGSAAPSVNINPAADMYNQRQLDNAAATNNSTGVHGFPNNHNQQQPTNSMDVGLKEELIAGNYPHHQQTYFELLWRSPNGGPATQNREVAPPNHLNFAQNNSMSLPASSFGNRNDNGLANGPGSTRSMLDQLLNNDPDAIIQELEQLLGM